MHLNPCPGCGVLLPDSDGATHEYMKSSPACWEAYGQVLAREYSSPALLRVNRLSVDAYAVQHPGGHSRQDIQSVGVHLARLCLFIERGLSVEDANEAMLRVGKTKSRMTHLQPPSSLGDVTVADVQATTDEASHREAVRRWSHSAWNAWEEHHGTVRLWVDAA